MVSEGNASRKHHFYVLQHTQQNRQDVYRGVTDRRHGRRNRCMAANNGRWWRLYGAPLSWTGAHSAMRA